MIKDDLDSGIPERVVLKVAVLSEGALLLLSLLWNWWRPADLYLVFDGDAVYKGLRATGPLIAFNFGVFGVLANLKDKYRIYREFRDKIVYPLCRNLSVAGALILAVCSGTAEEILFRGVMYYEARSLLEAPLAAVLVSLLFAYVHFIGVLRRYFAVFVFYCLFGLYFAYLVEWTGNLAVPIIAHGLYNFLAILMIKYFVKPPA
ncbi:MAG: CPBP family intramembrane metalloprotease [Deltaproteobacteria bacterium]|nr:CPBP family intramembrane metalloprotease [Deltaproteobacteria bacterium]